MWPYQVTGLPRTHKNYVPSRTGVNLQWCYLEDAGEPWWNHKAWTTLLWMTTNLKISKTTTPLTPSSQSLVDVSKKIPSVPKLQLAPKNCCNFHLPSKWLHTLTRFMYWPVRVSTWMESPIFTNRGTLTPAPVSVVAGFDPPGAWEPQESIQVCVLQKGEMRKYLISEENKSDIGGQKELEKLPWAVSPFRPGSVSVIFTTTVIGKSTSMTCKHTMRA